MRKQDDTAETSTGSEAAAASSSVPLINALPSEVPLLPIRNRILLPGGFVRLTIGKAKSVKLAESLWDAKEKTFVKNSVVAIHTVVPAAENEEDEAMLKQQHNTCRIKDGKEVLQIFEFGCLARVVQLSKVTAPVQGGSGASQIHFSLLVEGVARCKLASPPLVREDPFFLARLSYPALQQMHSSQTEISALTLNFRRACKDLLEVLKKRPGPIATRTKEVLESVDRANPETLVDVLSSANMECTLLEKQAVLGEMDWAKRLRRALEMLTRQVEVLKMSDKIHNQVEGKLKTSQREYYLRQQQKAIADELAQLNPNNKEEGDELQAMENNLKLLTGEAKTVADRELVRLRGMQPSSPEYNVLRTYLEWLGDLPWHKTTKDNLDVSHAKRQLDDDHFGLEKVKKRMVEFLAVRSLVKSQANGPILCLVGPPGVGKTSLGKSVATALGRKFRRMALGGVRDEAEIRGHRRTYVGAMPGNVVQALKKAGANNPVILLDEIDKLGRDTRGDPGSALLEVLDPEQNGTFTDHYLNVPFDLSKVMFIATANDLSTIPPPLLDRMEVIEVPGYSLQEKCQIGMRHLVTKQMERHGLTKDHMEFTEEGMLRVVESYTREAGVRQLDREIAAICRQVAVKVAAARDRQVQSEMQERARDLNPPDLETGEEFTGAPLPVREPEHAMESEDEFESAEEAEQQQSARPLVLLGFERVVVTADVATALLGPIKYENDVANRVSTPGVATGMAWTSVGGVILFIEVSISKGKGAINVTGRLGETMQESVKTALSFVKANVVELGLNTLHSSLFAGEDIEVALRNADIHVHFPAGAVQKDGPSAGVAITAALVSALSGQCVRNDTACTGEVTLRGLVLPVGGIKEKVLAAHRAGIKRVVLPLRNQKDTDELPAQVKQEMEIFYASTILEAMAHLFDPEVKANPPAWRLRVRQLLQEQKQQQQQSQQPLITHNKPSLPAGGEVAEAKDNAAGELLASKL